MPNINDGYIGFKAETVYGTPVVVDKFFEFVSEGIEAQYGDPIDSEGLRPGNKVLRADRWAQNPKGANGEIEMEVLDGGFQFFLPYMVGPVTTSAVSQGIYTHTSTLGTLDGKSFTMQSNRVAVGGTDQIFTWSGGKVTEWELSNSVDELLKVTLTCDFAKEDAGAGAGALAKQTPSYLADTRVYSYIGGTIKVDNTLYPVDEISVKVNNSLKDDRYKIAGSSAKLEQIENELREIEVNFKSDFSDMVVYNKMANGQTGAMELKWASPYAVAGGGFPSVTLTLPAVRFTEVTNGKEGYGVIEQEVTGMALDPGTGTSAMTFEYKASTN